MRHIDLLHQSNSPQVDSSLNGKTFDDSNGSIAPEPRDVHLVETFDQRSTAAQSTFAVVVDGIAGVVDVDYGGGESCVDAGDGDVALLRCQWSS